MSFLDFLRYIAYISLTYSLLYGAMLYGATLITPYLVLYFSGL
jgi:hypothetical protein